MRPTKLFPTWYVDTSVIIFHKKFQVLRVAACKDRERSVNDPFGESLIFCPKIPFGDCFLEIMFKSFSDFLFFRNSRKFESAVKVRFFGRSNAQIKP